MAVLSNADRLAIRAQWGSELSGRREPFNVSKPDLLATINAVDDWVEANAAAFNLAIPQPARNNLTAAQKTELLYLVARKRFVG